MERAGADVSLAALFDATSNLQAGPFLHRDSVKIYKYDNTLYGVKVTRVNTLNMRSKNKSRWTKSGLLRGKTAAWKKAIVDLAEGQTIDFYSNI